MGEIAAVGWIVAMFFAASWWMVRSESGKAIKTLIESRNYYRDQLEKLHKSALNVANIEREQKAAAPKRPPVLNSAAARAAVDRSNAPYFSAEKRIPNSEVLKEHSNG